MRLELGIDSSFAAAPADAVLTSAFTTRLLLRPSGDPVPGYTFSLAGPYVGTEIELSARLQPVPGLRFQARAGVLITYSGALPYVRLEAGAVL